MQSADMENRTCPASNDAEKSVAESSAAAGEIWLPATLCDVTGGTADMTHAEIPTKPTFNQGALSKKRKIQYLTFFCHHTYKKRFPLKHVGLRTSP